MNTYSPLMAIKLAQQICVKYQLRQISSTDEGVLQFIEEITPSLFAGGFKPREFLETVRGQMKIIAEAQIDDENGQRAREFFNAVVLAINVKLADL